ncbi:MAG: TIR domain-containing protein [Nitrospinae bacterium]|nr:TIR domain-containing protein [Nitrospinota bacterium]
MGGGGGGGRGLTPEELKSLEQRAKKSLKGGDGGGKCNVFISFSSDDLNEVNLLRGQAKNENSDIEFNDWSLKEPFDSKKADYIKRGIRERIRQCSVTVVYVSDETADSKWVDWEIRESIAMGKGVVAMHKGHSPPKRLPKAVTDNKVPVVPWNQNVCFRVIHHDIS